MDNQENRLINNPERKEKFFTKDKVCFFIVGLLLGAVIASAASLIYINLNSRNNTSMGPGNPPSMTDGGTPPEMPDGEMPDGEMPEGETPPEMPSDNQQESNDDSGTDNSSDSSSSDTSNSGNSKARPARPNNKSTSTDTNAS